MGEPSLTTYVPWPGEHLLAWALASAPDPAGGDWLKRPRGRLIITNERVIFGGFSTGSPWQEHELKGLRTVHFTAAGLRTLMLVRDEPAPVHGKWPGKRTARYWMSSRRVGGLKSALVTHFGKSRVNYADYGEGA